MSEPIPIQRCLRGIELSSEQLADILQINAPIVNVEYEPITGRIILIVWDETRKLAEAMPLGIRGHQL